MESEADRAELTKEVYPGGPTAPVIAGAYAMVRSGPEVNADEVESMDVVVEVRVLWHEDLVHVAHLPTSRSFHLGEELGLGGGRCDYLVPAELLGTTRAPIVLGGPAGASLVLLPGSRGYVELPGDRRLDFEELVASGAMRPSLELAGAFEYPIPLGAGARLELEGPRARALRRAGRAAACDLAFEVKVVRAGRAHRAGLWATFDPESLLYTGLSLLVHLGVVAAFTFLAPALRPDDPGAADRDRILAMQKLLDAAAERERGEDPSVEAAAVLRRPEGGSGAAALGSAGSMGKADVPAADRRYAVNGPADNPDPHLARSTLLREASQFGVIGMLASTATGDPLAPTAAWGRETSLGRDPHSALGNLFGASIGEAAGPNGLGLTGAGEGGGGRAESIGLGELGPFDHGPGRGPGQGIGPGGTGSDVGRTSRRHQPGGPQLREIQAVVNGRLPPDVIQRIVRQNFGRFRACYEAGVRANPSLEGRVTTRFVIDRAGRVAVAADGGSDLADVGVVRCVVAGFMNLSFPEPEGGAVSVVYPILFTPGTSAGGD